MSFWGVGIATGSLARQTLGFGLRGRLRGLRAVVILFVGGVAQLPFSALFPLSFLWGLVPFKLNQQQKMCSFFPWPLGIRGGGGQFWISGLGGEFGLWVLEGRNVV